VLYSSTAGRQAKFARILTPIFGQERALAVMKILAKALAYS